MTETIWLQSLEYLLSGPFQKGFLTLSEADEPEPRSGRLPAFAEGWCQVLGLRPAWLHLNVLLGRTRPSQRDQRGGRVAGSVG